jgi:hypothetical protein
MSSTTSITISRRSVQVAGGCALALAGAGFALAGALPAQAALDNNTKVWVCKYVGPPGNERFSQLNEVNWRSIADNSDDVVVGAWFGDNQQRSYVIKIGGTQPLPGACENVIVPGDEPTETATTPPQTETTTTPPETETTTTPPETETTTTPPETETTTAPVPTETETETTTAPVPTETTTTPAPTKTTPAPTKTTPVTPGGGGGGGAGDGESPSGGGGLGTAAPHTGGAGESGVPVNGLIGGGLLLASLGLFSRNLLTGRQSAPDSAN